MKGGKRVETGFACIVTILLGDNEREECIGVRFVPQHSLARHLTAGSHPCIQIHPALMTQVMSPS